MPWSIRRCHRIPMGELTTIMAPGRARGAAVVIQEIFGVNGHIRSVTDSFAAAGYTAIAPSLFDRVRRGIELGYSSADLQEGAGYRKQISPETALKDVAAGGAVVRHSGRVGVVRHAGGGTPPSPRRGG